MKPLNKISDITSEQAKIEFDITQKLVSGEDAVLQTGTRIFAQDVIDLMYDLSPEKFIDAHHLVMSTSQAYQNQGRGILIDLRTQAVSTLIRRHGAVIYTLAQEKAEEVSHVA